MDEVEKAEVPPFLSMDPVPDSGREPLSNLDLRQKSAALRSDDVRPFAGLTRVVFVPRLGVCVLQMRFDIEITVTTA
jgi:hypothetical protein